MATPQAPIGEEVSQATADVLSRLASMLSGKILSPRLKLLDLHDVAAATGLAERTIDRMVAEDRFPKPQAGIGKRMWRESTLIAWMDRNDPNLGDDAKGGD
jgi:predicted DNA-binding transcriptional regulator AlpA